MPKRKSAGVNVSNPLAFLPNPESSFKASKKKSESKSVDVVGNSNSVCAQDHGESVQDESLKEPNFNLYIGTDLGVLKGINVGGKVPISKSVWKSEFTADMKPPAVVSLTWADDSEHELMVTFSNHIVKTYNTKLKFFTRLMALEVDSKDKVVGLCLHDKRNYVFGLENGSVTMWNFLERKIALNFKAGDDLKKLRQCPEDRNIYATGGKETDLKIWNVSSKTPDVPIFHARNVPHDFLDLRKPVWIQDLTFLPRTTEVVAVGTRYGQVRLYDVRTSERPVSDIQFVDHPIMCISATMNDRQVVVGTAKGETGLYDLRNPGKEKLLLKYRGTAGSIRSIVACPELPYFVSCGLDRHVYVHRFSERDHIMKLYVKQQLNCIALSKSFMAELQQNKFNKLSNGNWANIPPEVLSVGVTPTEVTPLKKKVRKIV